MLVEFKNWFSKNREKILHDFFTFLRFKTIATNPKYDKDTKDCASWLVQYLKTIGLEAELWHTSGQPIVFAKQTQAGKDRPTLLIYQHYDVQPVDPLDLWKSDPFEPVMREGNIYARGAQDNKGQCFFTITALKAFLELFGPFPFNIKLFIEGEEESGSNGTLEVLEQKKSALQSDFLLVVDMGIPAPNIPAITLGVRGMLTMEVAVRTAEVDMHSGLMGGIACNAIHVLIRALSNCWDANGKIIIPGFYDDVEELSSKEKELFDFSINEEEIREEFGVKAFCPEPGYSLGESGSLRPTLEINGICGGYIEEGFKTVLPAVANAKISCRLVPHQNPEHIYHAFKKYLKSYMPKNVVCDVFLDQGARAFRSNQNSLIAKRAAKAYEDVMEKKCRCVLSGGSIPIVVNLAEVSEAETVLMGYGLDSDNIHAPNEHFGFDRFEKGFLTIGRILEQFHVE